MSYMTIRTLPAPILALLVAGASLAVLVWLWPAGQNPNLVTRWSGNRPQAGAETTTLRGEAAQAPSTGQLELRLDGGLYSGQDTALRAELDQALAYVTNRFGSGLSAPTIASVRRDENCGLQGIAYTDIRDAQVFTCDAIARDRAVAILAHEFTHQLAQDRYGPAHLRADLILSEGVATWAAGRYWLGDKPDFRSYVRSQRAAGVSFPLATHYAGLGAANMNALYYQWASFVEFLVDTYGRDRFDQLYVSGAGEPGSADYAGVYGKALPELEREWEQWVAGGR